SFINRITLRPGLKYEAHASVAYIRDKTTFIYYSFGKSDSCGVFPDVHGAGEIADGPMPGSSCVEEPEISTLEPNDPGATWSGPEAICAVKKPRPPATAVPILKARELQRAYTAANLSTTTKFR